MDGLGKHITVIPSEIGNFLINRKQTAELKTVPQFTEICSNNWLCRLLFILCPEGQTGLMAEGFSEEQLITVQNTRGHCDRAVIQRTRGWWSAEGWGNGVRQWQIMQHVSFFKVTTNIQTSAISPSPSFSAWKITHVMHQVMRWWKCDNKDRLACDSEELLRALQREPEFRHVASNP